MIVDYGFCFHWAFQQVPARVDAIMAGIADARAPRVRTAAPWTYVQTSKAVFDWTGTDYAVNKALEAGLKPLLLVNGRPNWAATAADYGIFAQMCAQRYCIGGTALSAANLAGGRGVTEFELWNEQNQWAFWGSMPVSPNDYTAYVKAAYAGIKAILPGTSSTVMLGGFNPTGLGMFGFLAQPADQFLTSCYAAGIKGNFDAVAHHPYTITTEDRAPWAPTTSSTYIVMADTVHDVMVANGDGAKKIWATEVGWAVPTFVNGATQAQYFADFRAIWEAKSYAGPWFAYEFYDEGTDVTNDQQMYGVVDNALNAKPALAWFRNLNGTRLSAALGAAGSLTTTSRVKTAVALTAVGALTAVAVASAPVSAPLTSEGTLSAEAELFGSKSAKLTAIGALTATALPSFGRPAPLAATGTLSATAVPVFATATPSLTAAGSLTATVGVLQAARTFTYDFTSTGSTKPTSLFTDFGLGYSVAASVANDNTASVTGEYYAGGIYKTDHASYYQSSTVHVGPLGDSFDRSAMAIVRASPDGANWVGATGHFPSAVGCQIITCIGGVITQRNTGTTGFTNADEMTLTAEGNLYSLYKNLSAGNTTPVLTWIDGAGDYAPYIGKRTGFGFQFVFAATTYGSPGIVGLWTGKDLADSIAYSSQAALSTTGTLTAVAGPGSASALSATGSLTAASKVNLPAPLTAVGVLTATAPVPLSAGLSATGALTATAGNQIARPAALSGSGALTAVATPASAVALSVAGSLSATAIRGANAALSSTGTLTATVQKQVLFDAVGAGGTNVLGFNPSISLTPWNHTCTGSNRAVLVALTSLNNGQAPNTQTTAVTYDGVAMTMLGHQDIGAQTFVEIWGLINPPTGAKAVNVTVTGPGNTGRALVGSSVSYTGVGSVSGTVATNAGSSGTSSLSVTSSALEMVVNALGSSVAQSAYTQTQRYNVQVPSNAADLIIGDAVGAATVSFGSTLASSVWGSIGIRLIPVAL